MGCHRSRLHCSKKNEAKRKLRTTILGSSFWLRDPGLYFRSINAHVFIQAVRAGDVDHPSKQPTNHQPTNQPTSWPTNIPTNQPTKRSFNQPTNQPTQPTHQPTNQQTNYRASEKETDQSVKEKPNEPIIERGRCQPTNQSSGSEKPKPNQTNEPTSPISGRETTQQISEKPKH